MAGETLQDPDALGNQAGHPVPVTIVTGFLGAGKSTLVQRWLEELPRFETAVIVNERGDVGIDGELLAAHVTRLREITGGCVCCNSQAELLRALLELGDAEPRPSRILIETSGAASPAGVIRALAARSVRERVELDGVVTVIDATRAPEVLEFDVAVEQLGFADVVVLSHLDRAAESALDALQPLVQRHAPAAVVVHAQQGRLESSFVELLGRRAEALELPAPGSPHSSIDAVSMIHDGELDEERFADWVEDTLGLVEARILRIKGILAMQGVDERVIVQGVSQAVDVQLGTPWADSPRTSRLVVLGLGLDGPALEAGWKRCAAK
ncbi:MAG TPA: GTP-binding protein [Polyangiales bacterium]|nr:GTP-binding protein [Polyangiales bacterium]